MKESELSQLIRLEASKHAVVLFRNNTGKLQDRNGRWVTYGLCVGSSDLIGWTILKITDKMIGKEVAVFTALEIKTEIGKVTKEQLHFLEIARKSGGIADVIRSEDDFKRLIENAIRKEM